MHREPIGVAVIGAGYWGPNLIRNLQRSASVRLLWVCDVDQARAQSVLGLSSTVRVTDRLETVLGDPAVTAVVVATPASTHESIGSAVLSAGRHLLMEKPLASTADGGRRLVELADSLGLVLMCDHTYCYTPAVQELRRMVQDGELGDIHYVDSVRINLGLVQKDVDVLWDLAPHDLSIMDYVLPEDMRPLSVSAQGADPLQVGRLCLAYLTLQLPGGGMAHTHVNWLSPSKIRRFVFGGSKRMVVWDDLQTSQRLSVFDRGIDLHGPDLPLEERADALVSYRTGDMVAPALPEREALGGVVDEFVDAIRTGRPPQTDGRSGTRVLDLLEAAGRSLAAGGATVALDGVA